MSVAIEPRRRQTARWVVVVALGTLVLPRPAHAHDASVLLWVLGPAVLLTPMVVAATKRVAIALWAGADSPSWLAILGVAVLELAIWLILAPLGAGVHVAGRWVPQPGLATAIPIALALSYVLNRRLLRSSLARIHNRPWPLGVHARLLAFAALTPLCAVGLGLAAFGVLALLA